MYKGFLGSAKAMNEDLWEELYRDSHFGVDADRFAKVAVESLPDVEALLQLPCDVGVVFAFQLIRYLADHIRGELDVKGGCGYGDSGKPYALMDAMMMRVITRRLQQRDALTDLTWVKDTLEKLQRKRDHIAEYGMEGFSSDTIAGLSELGRDLVEEAASA